MILTLTIAIPTYNRAGQVEARLRELIPQLVDGVYVHVFDNCCTDNTAEVVRSFQHPSIRYSRARQNMGMCRNICRGFEEAETEWLWILGDDDSVKPSAVSDALKWIGEATGTVVQFHSSGGYIERRLLISTMPDLFANHDVLGMMFISSLLFRVAPLRQLYLIFGAATFTFAPHVALILRMLDQQIGSLELRPETLLIEPDLRGTRWSSLEVALGVSVLPEFVATPQMQQLTARRLRRDIYWMFVYGLREVHDRASALKWRRIVRQSFANLRNYGAGPFFLRIADFRTTKQRKDFLLSALASRLPISILPKFAARMRLKHARGAEILVELQ